MIPPNIFKKKPETLFKLALYSCSIPFYFCIFIIKKISIFKKKTVRN